MQGKIFGIPLTVIVLILAIVTPVLIGELVIAKQLRELTRFVVVYQNEARTMLYQSQVTPTPEMVEEASPTAEPTERLRVLPTRIPTVPVQ